MDRPFKFDPLVEEVKLINCGPHYAFVNLSNDKEENVSLQSVASASDISGSGIPSAKTLETSQTN